MNSTSRFTSLAALAAIAACGARTTVARDAPASRPRPTDHDGAHRARSRPDDRAPARLRRHRSARRHRSGAHPAHRFHARVVRHAQHVLRHDVGDARHRRGAAVDPFAVRSVQHATAAAACKIEYYGKVQNIRRVLARDTIVSQREHRRRARLAARPRHDARHRHERPLRLVRLRPAGRVVRLHGHGARAPTTTARARRRSSSWRASSRSTFRTA